jgi:hypothetical protein
MLEHIFLFHLYSVPEKKYTFKIIETKIWRTENFTSATVNSESLTGFV